MGSQRRYYFDDWLNLHGFDRDQICTILSNASADITDEASIISAPTSLSLQDAKFTIFSAFESEMGFIKATELLSEIELMPQSASEEFPYTVDKGAGEVPLIVCSYQNNARTLINLAHEYAHALQLVLSQGNFMPPVYREVCAFLGEKALISYAYKGSPELLESLQEVWSLDNSMYLGSDLKSLSQAFESTSKEYNYRWNYPIARIISVNYAIQTSQETVVNLFKNSNVNNSIFLSMRKNLHTNTPIG